MRNNMEYFLSMDIIRVYAVFLIVLLHVSAPVLYAFSPIQNSMWWIGNAFDSFARAGVPLFFMISGLLVLGNYKRENINEFIRKRVKKVVIPLVAWSCIFFLWRIYFHNDVITINGIFRQFLEGSVYYHLWFLYPLISLYIAVPIVYPIFERNPGLIRYFTLFWFLFVSISALVRKMFGFSIFFGSELFTPFIGFFVIGYAMRKESKKLKKGVVIALGVLAYIVTVLGTFYLTRNLGEIDEFFYGYTSINVVVLSVCTFAIMRNAKWEFLSNKSKGFISKVKDLSFGVFLIHPIVIDVLFIKVLGRQIYETGVSPLISIPFATMVVFLVSAMLTLFLKKIPRIREII
ncbi:MAG: acyltransferase family protein [Nanoarchaeota archaeon]